jgi:hypothetical protein
MGEDRWETRRKHLKEDHEFRRAQSKRDAEILKGKYRIDQTQDEIDHLAAENRHREGAEGRAALVDRMHRERAFALERIAGCSSAHRHRWSERLAGIDLTRPGADAELTDLRDEVERELTLWHGFDLPSPPGPWERGTEPAAPSALELQWAHEEQERERNRRLIETELGLIVSSLGLLISTRGLYDAT